MKPRAHRHTAEELAQKHQQALHTYVREVWGPIPDEVEVGLRSLKAWGFDLIFGLREGVETVFVADQTAGRKAGDRYTEGGAAMEVLEVVRELPKGARIRVRVDLEDRRGVVRAAYQPARGSATPLFTLPAAELLLAFFKKRGFGKLLEAFASSGLTTEFVQGRGQPGRAVPFDALPPKMRRALREAQDTLKKHAGVGRFALAYFGKNKDGDDRYRASWLLPTVKLFDLALAEHVDKLLAALD